MYCLGNRLVFQCSLQRTDRRRSHPASAIARYSASARNRNAAACAGAGAACWSFRQTRAARSKPAHLLRHRILRSPALLQRRPIQSPRPAPLPASSPREEQPRHRRRSSPRDNRFRPARCFRSRKSCTRVVNSSSVNSARAAAGSGSCARIVSGSKSTATFGLDRHQFFAEQHRTRDCSAATRDKSCARLRRHDRAAFSTVPKR